MESQFCRYFNLNINIKINHRIAIYPYQFYEVKLTICSISNFTFMDEISFGQSLGLSVASSGK